MHEQILPSASVAIEVVIPCILAVVVNSMKSTLMIYLEYGTVFNTDKLT